MFERFRAAYAPLRDAIPAGSMWQHERLAGIEGYAEFASEFAGASFGGGLYRVHDAQTGPQALTLIAEAFPDFAERVCPFGYDWLGRQHVVHADRVEGGQPQVLMLDAGWGEVWEIPEPFVVFHDEVLLEQADAALALDFFEAWAAANGDALPLRRDQCVGYRIPLFLGGEDAVENLELSDLEVYWSISGQLGLATLSLPPGTPINRVVIG
jgi:hypothetical protein